MHIFCRETRAHLELHPHLPVNESTSGTLITPDLWMKNCKSPEQRTPSPSISPKPPEKPPQTSPLSLISVAHPSKLMSPLESPELKRNRLKAQKRIRKRLPSTISSTVTCNNFPKTPPIDAPQDLRIRHTPTDFDARVSINDNLKISQKEQPPEAHFRPIAPPLEARLPNHQQYLPVNQEPSPFQLPLRKPFDNILPPPTIIVPYPIILPLPIPIPIPIPIPNVFKKEETTVKDVEKKDASMQTENEAGAGTEKPEIGVEIGSNGDHSENIDVVGLVEKKEEEEEVKKVGRPLRKRKKPCEPKSRMLLKTRKVISATSN